MKDWNKRIVFFIVLTIAGMFFVNMGIYSIQNEKIPNTYIVEINRMYHDVMEGKALADISQENIQMKLISEAELQLTTYLNQSDQRLVLLSAQQPGSFYQFTYKIQRIPNWLIYCINFVFLCLFGYLLYLYLFVRSKLLKPFHQMKALAEALKNRDFTYAIPQQKSRYFGDFLWAIDMMKEELRAQKEKELQLLKEKKLMIAAISHDIKTPLATIGLYADAMAKDLYPKALIVQRINENCTKINHYIQEILVTNQEDIYDFHVVMKEIYLSELLPILKQEEERIRMALIAYEQSSCPNELIHTDPLRLREVIGNVIDNAIKYGDGQWIRVSFYQEDGRCIMAIANSGEQIPSTDINYLYQSFYRGQHTMKQKGNGLGLYICKQLMKQMDGDIFMTQQEGSVCFHLVLGTI